MSSGLALKASSEIRSEKNWKVLETARSLAHENLIPYIVYRWDKFLVSAHHKLIAEKLEEASKPGAGKRILITMPPRHGKSTIVSDFFPAWYFGKYPENQMIFATYAQNFAQDWGRKVRNHLRDPLHQWIFPESKLSEDSQSNVKFSTTKGGIYVASGLDGQITGRGAHMFLVDDIFKNQQDANSPVMRKRVKEWYPGVAYTRMMPGGSIVIMATRWHDDDLIGWLIEEHQHENWEILNLPALSFGKKEDLLRRPEGEALWPAYFPKAALEKIKATLPPSQWGALYQQDPLVDSGSIFEKDWWGEINSEDIPLDSCILVQSWDTAFKETSISDFSVCVSILYNEQTGDFYLVDIFRRRISYPQLKQRAMQKAEMGWSLPFGKRGIKPSVVLVEDKASGQSLIQDLKLSIKAPLRKMKAEVDKKSRAISITPFVEGGKVFLLAGAKWRYEFIQETSRFDNAKHDDQVDAFTYALIYIRDHYMKNITKNVIPISMAKRSSWN